MQGEKGCLFLIALFFFFGGGGGGMDDLPYEKLHVQNHHLLSLIATYEAVIFIFFYLGLSGLDMYGGDHRCGIKESRPDVGEPSS